MRPRAVYERVWREMREPNHSPTRPQDFILSNSLSIAEDAKELKLRRKLLKAAHSDDLDTARFALKALYLGYHHLRLPLQEQRIGWSPV